MLIALNTDLRIALYGRVSTDRQVGSIENQITFLRGMARHRSDRDVKWIVDDSRIYLDSGISGTNITNRPAVQQLIQDAKHGMFDVVMFKGISRFARDAVDAEMLLRTLQNSKVRVISFEENYDSANPNSTFIFKIHSLIAEYESEKIGVRVRLGFDQIAKRGQWPKGPSPFGYNVDKVTKKLVPNPEQAEIVKLIFDKYVNENMGARQIVGYLNALSMKTSYGKPWNPTTMIKLLKNQVYLGSIIYGVTRVKKTFDEVDVTLHKKIQERQSENIIVVADAHEPIIDELTFYQAQSIMEKRNVSSNRDRAKYTKCLLSGILICPKCGSRMFGRLTTSKYGKKRYTYYVCYAKRDQGICDQPNIRMEDADETVLFLIGNKLAQYSYERLRANLTGTQSESSVESMIKRITKRIDEIDVEVINANRKNDQGLIPDDILRVITRNAQQEKSKLSIEKNRLEQQHNLNVDTVNELDAFDNAVRRFKESDFKHLSTQQVKAILQQITDGVIIRSDDEVDVNLKLDIN